MDFGIFYEIQVNSPLKHREREAEVFHQVLDQVVAAEEAGFNNFWSVEHHFQPGFSHSSAPEVLYGALSQRTSRIRIGHAVVLLPFPYNHPVRVAERIATLDILSKGRVEVGTGRSGTIQELGGFGIPPEETRPRWEEALRLLVNIWTSKEGTFSWKGKYFDIPERSIVPLPVQKPHPPLWLACSNEETHKIAGRMGLGLLTLVVMVGPEEVARRINLYRDALKEVKPVGSFVNNRTAVFYMVHCADTDKEARENAEATVFLESALFRRYTAKLQFELDLWADLEHAGTESEDYARRLTASIGMVYRADGYLADMDAGFYSADYLRAWIRHAQLRSYLVQEVGEDWWRSSATGEILRNLFAEGTRPTSEEIAARLGYEPFDTQPLVAELNS